ncbi:MAG: amidohydrolase [Candidatus Njordarchaeales archaeon]
MIVLHPSIILTMDQQRRVLRDYFIGIEEGVIKYLGKEKPTDAEEVLELPNRIIIPGFVDSHTHVAMTLLRGLKDDADLMEWLQKYILPMEMRLKSSDVYYGALYGIAEMLCSGITMFLDMYYHEIEIAKAVADAGVRAMLSYGSADVFFNRSPDEEFKIAENFRTELENLAKTRNAEDRLFFAYGPHSPYGCTKELLEIFKEKSKETGYRIHIHLAETLAEVQQVKENTGYTPIEYLESIGFLNEKVMAAHVVWVEEKEFDILKRRRVNVLHNPISNLKLASGIAPVPRMLAEGINVALATDGPASNNRLDMFREMHVAAIIHKGYNRDPKIVPAHTVLEMATINGANALGLDKMIGSIEVGKKADLVVINIHKGPHGTPIHDPYAMIVYALDQSYVESVMVDGKWVYKDGEYANIDIDKIREKVQEIRLRLMEEAGIT